MTFSTCALRRAGRGKDVLRRRAALASGSGCLLSMLAELGFIGTIGENDEVPVEPESDSGDDEEEVGAGRGRSRGRERLGTSCGPQARLSVLRCPLAGRFTQAVRSRIPQAKSVLLPAQSGTHSSHLSVKSPRVF